MSEHDKRKLEPWVRMARRFHAVYRERYSKETSVHQFEDWIKEACLNYAKQQSDAVADAQREIERLQSEVRELRDVIRRGAAESVESQ